MKENINIKKFILIFVKVVIALFLFTSLNLLFMPKYIVDNNDGRITAEYYREKTPIDVIITGSSLIQAGVSPMTLYKEAGITAYDRSNSSQTIAISYYMAEDAIKRNKPKLVVADVGFMYEAFDYAEEPSTRKSLDGMKWGSPKANAIKASMYEEERFLDYVFPILRFHSRWNDLKSEDIKYLYYKPDVTYNGQLLSFEKNENYIEYNPYNYEEENVICNENLEYLQKICDLCKENDVELLIMKMPCIQGKWNHTFDSQVSELAERNGIKYKNFIEDFDMIGYDIQNDFYDSQHMNCVGAEKFSKVLAKYITDNYDVPDRRNDERVKKVFDKKLSIYESSMK